MQDAGKKPTWGDTFKLPIVERTLDSKLTLKVLDEDITSNDLIGEADIQLQEFLKLGQNTTNLFYNGKSAGSIEWFTSWEREDIKVIKSFLRDITPGTNS